MDMNQPVAWTTVEKLLGTLTSTLGGYTTACRGIITLANGQKLFVKIGHDPKTRQWTHKEIAVYRFLKNHDFRFMPKLLAVNDDETAFAIESLQDDWDWSDKWSGERLEKTLDAMDALALIIPGDFDKALFEKSFISKTADGWQPLAKNDNLQTTLRHTLKLTGRQDIADRLDFAQNAQKSAGFTFERQALVHNDVRADNCAWNQKQNTVKLIDWNWAQFGDRRIDVSAFFVHVYRTGFDIANYKQRLNGAALHWLAGFWFKAALQPIDDESEQPDLRDYQLASGIAAFDLAQKA